MAFFSNSLIENFCASYLQSMNDSTSTDSNGGSYSSAVTSLLGGSTTVPKVTLPSFEIPTTIDIPNVDINLGTNTSESSSSESSGGLLSSIGGDLISSFSGIKNNIVNAATTNQVQGWTTDGEVQSSTATALANIASNFGRGELSFSSYGFNISDYKKILLNSPDKDFASLRNLIEDYTISAGTAFLQGNLTSAFAAGVQQVNNVQNTLRSVVDSKQIIDKAEYIIDNGADMLKTTIQKCL